MLYLNIRLTQPMIGMHTQLGKLEAHSTPARLHTENRQARSNQGTTQPSIEIDSYPSRHSYGFDTHADFAREAQQRGFEGVQQGVSSHTQQAWDNIENGARPGTNLVVQQAKGEISSFINQGKNRHIVAEHIPDPVITVHPGEVRGEPEAGDVTEQIDTDAFAQTNFTPGQVQTYMKQQGRVRQWVTEGRYDIYA
jgi:hypothetical protein